MLWGLCLRRTVRELALALLEHVAFRLVQERRRPDCMFSEVNTQPTYSPHLRFTACLATYRAKLGAERIATPFS